MKNLSKSANKKNRGELKILLMQIREDEQVAKEELNSFANHAGLKPCQLEVLNCFETPVFDETVLKGYDSLWVGGASEANVLQPQQYTFMESAKKLLLYCCENNIPVFASCFGFQLAILALSGEIVDSDGEYEMGTIPISLAKSSKHDLLLHDTPEQFLAVSVHKQKAIKLPLRAELLAYTDTCLHVIKVKNKPFWAFQFHPEVDLQILIERLTIYQECYTEGSEHLSQVLSSAKETPESNVLMRKFVDRVLLV